MTNTPIAAELWEFFIDILFAVIFLAASSASLCGSFYFFKTSAIFSVAAMHL